MRREGDGLAIEWSDGVHTFVAWQKLRKGCPCATCNEERQKPADPFKLLSESEIAAGAPQPAKMVPRGRYAYQIVWTDGHDAGIYPLELLRALSEPR
ncbi:MAG TPA: DUF971 domain-containing protein [Gemmataceae bacterium]|jgi:DUF971 family protein|nr:DUF971 domain-containing protein [Gemmataceae bacterium]